MGVCCERAANGPRVLNTAAKNVGRRTEHVLYSTIPVKRTENTLRHSYITPRSAADTLEDLQHCEVRSRILIAGVVGGAGAPGFEEKERSVQGAFLAEDLPGAGVGLCCKKGLKGAPNQDDYSVTLDPKFSLFSVFDGHGVHGHEVSNFSKELVPEITLAHESFQEDPMQSLRQAYVQTHTTLIQNCEAKLLPFDCAMSGTTATTVLIKGRVMYIGYVGDSRAVLGVRDTDGYSAIRLTVDHKPETEGERERITAHSAEVKKYPEGAVYRVFKREMQEPGLALSRAIGDSMASSLGVTCEPALSKIEVVEESEFLLICSDGLWEQVSDQEAVEIVSRYGKNCQLAAERLASTAWTRWIKEEGDLVDDITVIVIYLPWQCKDK